MTIEINKLTKTEASQGIELTVDGNKTFMFFESKYSITALMMNASNRAWNKCGTTFSTWEKVKNHYKSAAAHAAINEAIRQFAA